MTLSNTLNHDHGTAADHAACPNKMYTEALFVLPHTQSIERTIDRGDVIYCFAPRPNRKIKNTFPTNKYHDM